MSHQDDPSDPSKSLLRRRLQEERESRRPPDSTDDQAPGSGSQGSGSVRVPQLSPRKPASEGDAPVPISPIRPTAPNESEPQDPLAPFLQNKPPAVPLTPREQMQRAEEALIALREKMSYIASEFAQGRLNPVQFNAMYSRHSEQRDIIERLLARNPESQAWETVVQSAGQTRFLQQHYAARVLSYAIYDQETGRIITLTGSVYLAPEQITAVLNRLQTVIRERGNPGSASKKIDDDRTVLLVPGEKTTAAVIFSFEPAAMQVKRVEDIHRDFERANQHALRSGDYTAERLVFPHRALFEEKHT